MDFRSEHGSILAPKWKQKSRLTSKARFLENSGFPLAKTMILMVPRGPKSTKIRSKIDQKWKPKIGSLLASICGGFWWVLGANLAAKRDPERVIMTPKWGKSGIICQAWGGGQNWRRPKWNPSPLLGQTRRHFGYASGI